MSLSRNREVAKAEHVQGGEGYILRDLLLQGEQLHGQLTYASTITLEPGCSIGVHTHTGDSEMYFIYQGTGTYTDNDESYPVQAGDVLFCKDGETHGIANTGDGDLKFVAVMQAS
ncbi:cupin domain-containing protein [Anaerotardibacter muris]|uniref:cupin domain-containing protein n=1 Tax=Anaerotardibacter muris TaxID=2941505 RepID=UPI0020409004|nr:cupin domain-containing protein [Anaerotardibacter muris]